MTSEELDKIKAKRIETLRKDGWTEQMIKSFSRGWDSVNKTRRAK